MNSKVPFPLKPFGLSLAAVLLLLPIYSACAASPTDPAPEAASNSGATAQTPVAVDPAQTSENTSSSDGVKTSPPSRVKEIAAAVNERQGVLTPHGQFVLDPSVQYTTSSSSRLSIVGYTVIPAVTVGIIDVREITRYAFMGALDGRYGLTNRLEVSAHVPYVTQHESSQNRPFGVPAGVDEVFSASGSGIGDVQFGFRYQFNDPTDGGPYYIGNLRVSAPTGKGPFDVPYDNKTGLETKIPTGAGFWGLQLGTSVLLPSDPAVFYGGINYEWYFKKNVDKELLIDLSDQGIPVTEHIGEVQPGSIAEFNFGMGFGINDKSSFSLGYDHSVVFRSKINGQIPINAQVVQVGQLLLGYSYSLSPKQNFNLQLGVGVTRDAPDAQITIRAPLTL
ncbi:transporter [Neisseriaceae bacterium JH1-16]|nr:transporter [Neisseriaceae bacterium JH1-16]